MQYSVELTELLRKELGDLLIEYSRNFNLGIVLNSHSQLEGEHPPHSHQYDLLAAFGESQTSDQISDPEQLHTPYLSGRWWFGFLTYDLKNKFENLNSQNPDYLNWPELFFFSPDVLIRVTGNKLIIDSMLPGVDPQKIFTAILETRMPELVEEPQFALRPRMSREEYIAKIFRLKEHIQRGDIYEINYCQEFYDTKSIDPYIAARFLGSYSPSPFGAFIRYGSKYLLSASPERFLSKRDDLLCTQPIKGTAARGQNAADDAEIQYNLQHNPKERSENIMIVDLVRNDLSRIARNNSVCVEELCGVYTFPQVHQMISTVTARCNSNDPYDILKATFPMGSMTGAPKIEAMKIAEEMEVSKRGLYSGSVGYITPGLDFDFNVVIRSLQYRADTHYLSYMTGSAITALSDPEKEYDECVLKAYGLLQQKLSYDFT